MNTIIFSTDKIAVSLTNEVSVMVIIPVKLGSNINYGQGRGTVLTSPVAAAHDKWERDPTVDKAQLYKQPAYFIPPHHKGTEGTKLRYTHSMHHLYARHWFQVPAPSHCYPLH
jgi:hypothetical protein